MHREEDQVNANKSYPKLYIPHPIGDHLASHFGKPIIESRKYSEKGPHGKNIMKMRHHEIGIMKRNIHTPIGQGNACNTTDNKENDKAQSVKHRRFKCQRPAPHGRNPTENFNACWNSDNKGCCGKIDIYIHI